MRPQNLLPTTWQAQAGVILGPEQKTMEAALKTLAGGQGTMFFALPLLRPDGSPNLLVMANNRRRFSFDGGSRSISFTTTTSTGNLKTISHALPDGSYETIVIGCLWDDQKDEVKLIVGGKEFL
jgi:microcystin-dependent protein